MGVRQQMISILRSGETRRIRFSFTTSTGGTITVNADSFARVAGALERNELDVVENYFDRDIAMYSAFANPANGHAANTFYLGRNPRWSRTFNALIVHESVHASFDLTRSTLPWLDNEAAAYIAQGYYLRNSGYQRHWLEFGSQASIGYQYINEVIDGGDTAYFLSALRDSLNADRQYHSYIRGTFTGNG